MIKIVYGEGMNSQMSIFWNRMGVISQFRHPDYLLVPSGQHSRRYLWLLPLG